MMGIEKLAEIWPDWKVESQLGEGAFGKVYKAVRNDSDLTTYAAIKVITVPKSESEIESLQADGMSIIGAKTYLQGIVSDFINEIRLMESMKGNSNIVSVEDYKVVEKKEGIGWDIFIRMELLTPLVKCLAQKRFTEKDVIKLGIDICSALEVCSRRKVIHRDIKPENIFVSEDGNYKIGDFGIARQLEKTGTALSSKGTFNYISPEVAKGYKYDARVDIYSLGIVLYKLLNNNRLPFIDPNKELLTYEDKKLGVDRRLSGEPLPAPLNASRGMATLIDMACRYNPEERFSTPSAMKNALIRLYNQASSAHTAPVRQMGSREVAGHSAQVGTPSNFRTTAQTTRVPPPINNQGRRPAVYPADGRIANANQTHNRVNQTQNNSMTNRTVGNRKSKADNSGKALVIAVIAIAFVAIAVIIVACTALAGNDGNSLKNGGKETSAVTTSAQGYDVVLPDFYYESPLYRYVDVDDQYDGDPIRMRTGPGKDGTEKIMEIPDGNYLYVHGGLSDRNDWVYVEFNGNYGWVLSKYLH